MVIETAPQGTMKDYFVNLIQPTNPYNASHSGHSTDLVSKIYKASFLGSTTDS